MASTLECDNCGASLALDTSACAYCGSTLLSPVDHPSDQSRAVPAGFGFSGAGYHLIGLAGLAGLYGSGWMYEDTRYWLDTRAYIIWCGIVPLWLFLGSVFRRSRITPILLGIGIGLALFLCHLAVMAILRGSLNDDMVGMAAIIGGSALAGWLGGLFLRRRILAGHHQRQPTESDGI